MRLFVYEHLMAGGAGEAIRASLLAEGQAMLSALVADFLAAGHAVTTMLADSAPWPAESPAEIVRAADPDRRRAAFARLACQADWSLVIAPELGGQLLACCQAVHDAGGRLLGPSRQALEICCDKHATAEHLGAAGVPAPVGMLLRGGQSPKDDALFPAVLKPCDGAGSCDVLLLGSMPAPGDWPLRSTPQRLERFCPGVSVSVSLLVSPQNTGRASGIQAPSGPALLDKPAVAPTLGFETASTYALPPCHQHLSDDGQFRHLGGSLPIEPALASRAERLARRAAAAIPGLFGYVGFDLVLGDDPTGRDDVVIEVNPRLTTSYIGLRRLAEENLAQALLDVAAGRHPRLAFGSSAVRFSA
ncbi:MAG: ATP-grasp domain-containing protein [Pirellulales bacterium]